MKKKPNNQGPKPLILMPVDSPQGSIDAAIKAGYIPILTDSPNDVKILLPGSDAIGSDMLMSALYAIDKLADTSMSRVYFVNELFRRMKLNATDGSAV